MGKKGSNVQPPEKTKKPEPPPAPHNNMDLSKREGKGKLGNINGPILYVNDNISNNIFYIVDYLPPYIKHIQESSNR